MTAAVQVEELVKRYPKQDRNAVDGLSFTVKPGEIFGLLGPNGAGKSTTIGVLTTRIRLTAGDVRVAGVDVMRDPVAARRRIAVVPQQANLDRELTPRQNLTFHAAYHGVPRIRRDELVGGLLTQFGLAAQADAKLDWYSGGMAQRLMIARAMMHEPAVLFLDEPTTGLDPQARLFLWERVRELRARGVTIVLTTHDLEEASVMADRVGIVDHGRMVAMDTPAGLTRGLAGRSVLDVTMTLADGDEMTGVVVALQTVVGVDRAEPLDSTSVRLALTNEPETLIGPVVTLLAGRSATVTALRSGAPTLEDVFLHLTGDELR
ncbi:ABC transporter ATP-binding protein [Micromonospora endolithica]|uniref:ABC transporter ATP-binding protein n=1 Tax=Micromonospora endolithica TaxID=230091 RepID=A0A3A9Z6W0_9ACTN|nr:ABC transporter ATP-binding protein [Micromonospora endolithica]RKN44252.1 ABC transporter ATP-binding protein [Micromonospora endolithica]TWJ25720.1 ABC-2 type transport system ATP-binding protein [Micromonospora endolithica]